ncbi:MAG: ABC transporter permease [Flavobacteriales bacterium]|nr:ABC transporter permease [Flavobacteriales bacterium]
MAKSNRHLGARPVVRIATAGVALGVALMILASAIVHGFQHEVKKLVVGFDSHIHISPSDATQNGLVWSQGMLDSLRSLPEVTHVALRHECAGIVETPQAIQGVVVRGLDATSRQGRMANNMRKGNLPKDAIDHPEVREVAIGAPLAKAFELDTGDRITVYLVIDEDNIRPRPMRISGIYDTGLQEFDKRHVWISAPIMQSSASRGAEAQVVLEPLARGQRAVGQAFGQDAAGETWTGRWAGLPEGQMAQGRRSIALDPLPASATPLWIVGNGALADTVRLVHQGEEGWTASISQGSHHMVAEGYDVWATSLANVAGLQETLFRLIPYDWQAIRVDQQNPEMFSWLSMLDLNVDVIVGLMVLISIINMTSALLIIILERRAQVGLLKAMGMTDAAVIRTFIWHAARILGQGFAWGNLVGLGLVWVQATWKVVPLDPAAYYVSAVPILVDAPGLCTLETVAFVLCVVAMVLPALWSTRIRPALTLRMN